MSKTRLTVTVDRELVDAANRAVAAGDATSLSGWVNAALADHVARETRRRVLRELVAEHEARSGHISAEDIAAQARADRAAAIVVRGRRATKKTRGKRSAA